MKVFNRTKHELYDNIAIGIVERYAPHLFIGYSEREHLFEEISRYKGDSPMLLEHVADNLLKKMLLLDALTIYQYVKPDKAKLIREVIPNEDMKAHPRWTEMSELNIEKIIESYKERKK